MRRLQRLNPTAGIADFWTEFKRPNPYRWPVLAGSALLTGSLLYLLTDHAASFNWVVGGVLALIGGVAIAAMIADRVKVRFSILLVAAAITGTILYQFSEERWRIPPAAPEVTYISTFADGRSDSEIAASNRANQAEQDRLRAEQKAREEEAREAYRALGRAAGMDVEGIEREIAREKAQAAEAERAVAD